MQERSRKEQESSRILAVDDNVQSLTLLERLLQKSGFEVVTATNGSDALSLARQEPPDLVVTDILMPVMDGFELCRRWKSDERLRSIPFIFFTATYTDERDKKLGLGIGADRFIVKPQEPEILLKAIREVLEEHRSKAELESTKPFGEELEFFRSYNKVLFRKLEKKMSDLGRLNRSLEHEIEVRKKIEGDRTRLLEKLRAACDEADRANQAKDVFLATLSHELRTPLTAILNWAQLLGRGKMDSTTVPKAAQAIEKSAWEQKHLIDDLLDISMIISGKLSLCPIETDVAVLVSGEVEAFRELAKKNHVEITSEIGKVRERALMDPVRFRQIISNILGNAVKFSPPGGKVHVTLAARADRILVSVADSGPGIRAEWLGRIFEPFQQVDGSMTRAHKGLGMGLTIVRNLVQIMNGKVWAESPGVGQGSVFRIDLPLVVAAKPVTRQTAVEAEGATLEDPARSLVGKNLLLVDDDPSALDSLGALLRSVGMTVRAVASAREAIDSILQEAPDILISDIAMPEEDGYSLIRKIRAAADAGTIRTFPAVALTAFADRETIEKAHEAGFDASSAKPVDSEELLSLLAATLSPHRSPIPRIA